MKEKLFGRLAGNKFTRNVGVLVGGTVGSQIIALMAAPILTRLFSPEDFGILAVYIGVLSLISVLASFKYELAIPVPEEDKEAFLLAMLSLILVVTVTALLTLFMAFWGDVLFKKLNVPALSDVQWLLPMGLFLVGIFQIFSYLGVRLKVFTVIASAKVGQQLATIFLQFALFKFGSIGLVFGQAFGKLFGIVALSKKMLGRFNWQDISLPQILILAEKYKSYPLYTTWGGLLNTAGAQVPTLLFAAVFGPVAAGLYALSHRIIALPMGVVGQAVSQVFLSDAPKQYREGGLAQSALRAQRTLIKVITPVVIILIVFGPNIFNIAFGKQWAASGTIASWLALWMLVSFSTSPLSVIFPVIEKQAIGLGMQIVLFLFRLLGLGVGAYYNDFMIGIVFFSVFNVVGYLFYQIVSFGCLGLPVFDTLKGYILVFPAVFLAFVLKGYSLGDLWVGLFLLMMFVSIVYYYKLLSDIKYEIT